MDDVSTSSPIRSPRMWLPMASWKSFCVSAVRPWDDMGIMLSRFVIQFPTERTDGWCWWFLHVYPENDHSYELLWVMSQEQVPFDVASSLHPSVFRPFSPCRSWDPAIASRCTPWKWARLPPFGAFGKSTQSALVAVAMNCASLDEMYLKYLELGSIVLENVQD